MSQFGVSDNALVLLKLHLVKVSLNLEGGVLLKFFFTVDTGRVS